MHCTRWTLLATALLCGCASAPPTQPTSQQLEATKSSTAVSSKLLDSSTRVEGLLIELSRTRMAGGAEVAPLPLSSKISVDYQGDAALLVRKVATMSGLQFQSLGRVKMPLPVSINVHDEDLVRVLELIAYQLGKRADIALTDVAIEIRYANP